MSKKPSEKKLPQDRQLFDFTRNTTEPVRITERNGNLFYAERQDGSGDWVTSAELD